MHFLQSPVIPLLLCPSTRTFLSTLFSITLSLLYVFHSLTFHSSCIVTGNINLQFNNKIQCNPSNVNQDLTSESWVLLGVAIVNNI